MKTNLISVDDAIKTVNRVIGRVCKDTRKWEKVSEKAPIIVDAGENPEKRPIKRHITHGIVVVDKPPGPTSHEIVAWIKQLLGVTKAGHGGTLEPLIAR